MNAYGSLAPVYDAFTRDVDYGAFADFYEAAFARRKRPVCTVLDLGCGTGTLTALLARRGYELLAADASPDMLMVAQEKFAALPDVTPPLFLCQSMTELDLYGTVDAAVSCLDAVNYLPPKDLPELLRRLHLFLEPDGVFVFDIQSPARLRALDGSTSVDEDENSLCLWRADFDEQENALCYGMDLFTRRGRLWERSCEEHVEYVHDPETLRQRLAEAGFVNIEVSQSGPQGEHGRLFVTAENTPH